MKRNARSRESLEEFVRNVRSEDKSEENQAPVIVKRIEYYRDEYCDESQLFYSMR